MDSYGGMGDPYGGMGGYGDGYGGMGEDPYGGYGGGDSPAAIPVEEIESMEDLTEFLEQSQQEPAIIGYFDLATHSADKEIFDETQKALSQYRFAFTTDKDVIAAMKLSGCAVVVYRPSKYVSDKYEKIKSRYPSKSLKSSSALQKFIQEKALPLVGLKTGIYDSVSVPEVTLFAEVDVEKNFKQFQYYANRMRKVATDYTSKLVFNIANKEDFNYKMKSYGLDLPDRKDTGVGLRSDNLYYKMETAFSMDNLRVFVEDFLAGKLVGKEQEFDEPERGAPPQEEDLGPTQVVTLDNTNFEEIVTKSTNDVMVEFYAPWCGHCKALKPEYHQLAEEFADVPTVTVAAMDASTHTAPEGFDVQGFPTLYFVPGDKSKKPLPYEGNRETKAMADFIKKHATNKIL